MCVKLFRKIIVRENIFKTTYNMSLNDLETPIVGPFFRVQGNIQQPNEVKPNIFADDQLGKPEKLLLFQQEPLVCFKNGHPQVEIPDVAGLFHTILAKGIILRGGFFLLRTFICNHFPQISFSSSTRDQPKFLGIFSVYPQISSAKFHIHIMQHFKHHIEQRSATHLRCHLRQRSAMVLSGCGQGKKIKLF